MDKDNEKLLNEVINDRLAGAVGYESFEDRSASLDQAMKAIDRQVELTKLEDARNEKLRNEQFKMEEARKDRTIRWVEVIGTLVLAPTIDYVVKNKFATRICNFEKDYTFTTQAGRSLSNLFRFKK